MHLDTYAHSTHAHARGVQIRVYLTQHNSSNGHVQVIEHVGASYMYVVVIQAV
jgi:hypothetical protein